MRFLFEERTEPYLNTVREHSQEKIAYVAKNDKAEQALLGLFVVVRSAAHSFSSPLYIV
jgi:hypothetical protein